MADYYVVPKTALDATADAVREKLGSEDSIEFTQNGFADAVEAIETGGYSLAEIAAGDKPEGELDITGLSFTSDYAFAGCSRITRVIGKGSFAARNIFQECVGITTVNVDLTSPTSSSYFFNCTGLRRAVIKKTGANGYGFFSGCSNLEIYDYNGPSIGTNDVANCNNLSTMIFRRNDAITALVHINYLLINHFKSGGSGGTIYIPKVLYDELGTGSSLDYKAATNWSTVDGYGTITWAQIEGSIYETQYADGTPIT